MKTYIDDIRVTDSNGEEAILYPRTKQEAVEGLEDRLSNIKTVDIIETTETTLENSSKGRLKINEIVGVTVQGENPTPTNPLEINSVSISGIKTHDGKGNESTINFLQPISLYLYDVTSPKIAYYDKVVFDGTNFAVSLTDSNGHTFFEITGILKNKKITTDFLAFTDIICSHFIVDGIVLDTNEVNNACSGIMRNTNLYIRADQFSTVEEFKAFFAQSPMTIVYGVPLETESSPILDQIALNSLQTYDGITYVEFDSEVQPTFNAEYGTSKVGGYTLESLLTARNSDLKQELATERLSALEASVVNNI